MSDVEALQTTLAAEHAAVWVYGLLGGRTSASATPSSTAPSPRRTPRTAAGATGSCAPSPTAARHRSPRSRRTRSRTGERTGPGRRVALATEQACAATYSWLVANTVADERRWAIRALNEAAVRELAFRGTPEMFPGAGEHADR